MGVRGLCPGATFDFGGILARRGNFSMGRQNPATGSLGIDIIIFIKRVNLFSIGGLRCDQFLALAGEFLTRKHLLLKIYSK